MNNRIEKALEVLGEEITTKILGLTDAAADKFIAEMESIIAKKKKSRAEEEAKKHKPSRAEMVKAFQGYGFIVPSDAKFYHISESRVRKGCKHCFGFQIGAYTHSCQVDTTDFIVLLILDNHNTWVEEFDGVWMNEVKK